MLNWIDGQGAKTLWAEIGNFKYIVSPFPTIKTRWGWILNVAGVFVDRGGPLTLNETKAACEADYAARIGHAKEIIQNRKWTKPYKK